MSDELLSSTRSFPPPRYVMFSYNMPLMQRAPEHTVEDATVPDPSPCMRFKAYSSPAHVVSMAAVELVDLMLDGPWFPVGTGIREAASAQFYCSIVLVS